MNNKLPKDWKIVNLKSITDTIQYGYTESSSKVAIGPKFLRITDIQENNVNWEEVPYCKIDSESKSKYLLKDGDLVFARTGATVGKSFLIKGKIPEAIFASYLIRVRVNLAINEKYLSYFFQSPEYWKQITNDQVGTGQPNVNGTKLGLLKIVIAPLETQQAIVSKIEELFSELDKGIEDLKTAQQQLKTYRQSVLKWAFEGKLTNENVKDGELPEGWESKTFNDIIEISKEKYKPNNSESKFYIGLEHIEKNIGALTPECGIEEIKTLKNKFNIGEILYGKLRPYLNKVYLAKENGVCSTDILVLKTRENCNAQFLTHLMLGVDFVNTMSENTSGVNLPRVSTKFILEYPINLPPIKEQHQIVQEIERRLSVADKMEESIAQSLQQAEALRQSILKKAFSGELV